MIYLIAADTSTPLLSLSLLVAENKEATAWHLAEQFFEFTPPQRDDWLHTAIASLLARKPNLSIDALAVGQGPGSFTGLRVSFSYFRTLAVLQNIPLLTFSSMEYWRSCFALDSKIPFLTRINRTLFYGIEESDTTFKAQTLEQWYEQTQQANVWCETWRENNNFPIAEEKWPRFKFLNTEMLNCTIPPLPKPVDIFNQKDKFHWYKSFPNYGHELPFLKNPVQARKNNHEKK